MVRRGVDAYPHGPIHKAVAQQFIKAFVLSKLETNMQAHCALVVIGALAFWWGKAPLPGVRLWEN